MFDTDPISRIEWKDASTLEGNSYNPNRVFPPELALLERSVLLQGYVQPILIQKDGLIIDGFHRSRLALVSEALLKRYNRMVPCAVLDVDRPTAMILTIRMNRAKGTHVAVKMSAIVHELLDVHHYDPQEIMAEIGATREEVELLRQDGVFSARRIPEHKWSQAWYPAETGSR